MMNLFNRGPQASLEEQPWGDANENAQESPALPLDNPNAYKLKNMAKDFFGGVVANPALGSLASAGTNPLYQMLGLPAPSMSQYAGAALGGGVGAIGRGLFDKYLGK